MRNFRDACTIFQNGGCFAAERRTEVRTMRKNMNTTNDRESRRMQADREELAERIALAMPNDGTRDVQPGLNLARFARPTELHHGFYEPCFCVIAQGAKTLALGEDVFRYDPAHYMIAT